MESTLWIEAGLREMKITHSTVNGVVAVERDQLVVTNKVSSTVDVTLEKSEITHVSIQVFVIIFKVFIVETLIWVDVYIFVHCIIGKDIIMEMSLVMNVTLGPAVVSKAFNIPVDKNITLGSFLVEMNKTSGTVSSLKGFFIIVMLMMRWLIKANGMATFVGERNSFVVAWVESGGICVINPQKLIG